MNPEREEKMNNNLTETTQRVLSAFNSMSNFAEQRIKEVYNEVVKTLSKNIHEREEINKEEVMYCIGRLDELVFFNHFIEEYTLVTKELYANFLDDPFSENKDQKRPVTNNGNGTKTILQNVKTSNF